MASSLVVPTSSSYFRCVIDSENANLFPKSSTITYKIFVQNESIRKNLKLKLKKAMEINLHAKITKLSNEIKEDCKKLKKNYKNAFHKQQDGQLIKENSPSEKALSHPEKLWKVMEVEYQPLFCNMATNSTMRQILESHMFKWQNREKWIEDNFGHLLQTFIDAEKKFVGREDIIDEMFALVVTFANNPLYVSNSHLNFALLGKKGSGKTMIANLLRDVLRYSGILVGSKDEGINKTFSFKATDFLGDTAKKTQEKTISILESCKEHVIHIDDAEKSASHPQWKRYGKVILETFQGFLKKNKGNIAILVSGDTTTTIEYFFGVYKDITKCFPFIFILRDYSKKNLIEILKKELKTVYSIPKGTITNNAFEYLEALLHHEGDVVEKKVLSPPGEKYKEKVVSKKRHSYTRFLFPNSAKDIQQFGAYVAKSILSNGGKSSFDTKKMHDVLKLYLLQYKKRKVQGNLPNMESLKKGEGTIVISIP